MTGSSSTATIGARLRKLLPQNRHDAATAKTQHQSALDNRSSSRTIWNVRCQYRVQAAVALVRVRAVDHQRAVLPDHVEWAAKPLHARDADGPEVAEQAGDGRHRAPKIASWHPSLLSRPDGPHLRSPIQAAQAVQVCAGDAGRGDGLHAFQRRAFPLVRTSRGCCSGLWTGVLEEFLFGRRFRSLAIPLQFLGKAVLVNALIIGAHRAWPSP